MLRLAHVPGTVLAPGHWDRNRVQTSGSLQSSGHDKQDSGRQLSAAKGTYAVTGARRKVPQSLLLEDNKLAQDIRTRRDCRICILTDLEGAQSMEEAAVCVPPCQGPHLETGWPGLSTSCVMWLLHGARLPYGSKGMYSSQQHGGHAIFPGPASQEVQW